MDSLNHLKNLLPGTTSTNASWLFRNKDASGQGPNIVLKQFISLCNFLIWSGMVSRGCSAQGFRFWDYLMWYGFIRVFSSRIRFLKFCGMVSWGCLAQGFRFWDYLKWYCSKRVFGSRFGFWGYLMWYGFMRVFTSRIGFLGLFKWYGFRRVFSSRIPFSTFFEVVWFHEAVQLKDSIFEIIWSGMVSWVCSAQGFHFWDYLKWYGFMRVFSSRILFSRLFEVVWIHEGVQLKDSVFEIIWSGMDSWECSAQGFRFRDYLKWYGFMRLFSSRIRFLRLFEVVWFHEGIQLKDWDFEIIWRGMVSWGCSAEGLGFWDYLTWYGFTRAFSSRIWISSTMDLSTQVHLFIHF